MLYIFLTDMVKAVKIAYGIQNKFNVKLQILILVFYLFLIGQIDWAYYRIELFLDNTKQMKDFQAILNVSLLLF